LESKVDLEKEENNSKMFFAYVICPADQVDILGNKN